MFQEANLDMENNQLPVIMQFKEGSQIKDQALQVRKVEDHGDNVLKDANYRCNIFSMKKKRKE